MAAERIRANLGVVERAIADACRRSGRKREEVTLIAVSKTFPPEDVDSAIEAGVADVGENRVQEARLKIPAVHLPVRWHLIGHLQSNKAAEAARLFDVIQTVDRVDLARRLGREAEEQGIQLEVLLQINLGGEAQKSGAKPEEARELANEVSRVQGLRLTGLMTIPPAGDPDEARRCFSALRRLRDQLAGDVGPELRHLSMGMSEDFELAIEEGSTMVRVGRGIFGSREMNG